METCKLPISGESPQQSCKTQLVARGAQKDGNRFHGNRSWFLYGVLLVAVCSVITNLVTVYLCMGLQNQVDRQNVVIEQMKEFMHSNKRPTDVSASETSSTYSTHRMIKRSRRNRRRGGRQSHKRREGRRSRNGSCNCTKERILKYVRDNPSALPFRPAAHLSGTSRPDHYNHDNDYGYILDWQRPDNLLYSSSFRLHHRFHSDGVTDSLGVRTPGLYFIYSQVALNGRNLDARNHPLPDCGHEIVAISGGELRVLLTSVTTQDQRGRAYQENPNPAIYPLDTQSTQGIVQLQRGDKLKVRISGCHHSMDRLNSNGTLASFGAFLVNFSA